MINKEQSSFVGEESLRANMQVMYQYMNKKMEGLNIPSLDLLNNNESFPLGGVICGYDSIIPPAPGFLRCNGTVYNISDYPELAQLFKDKFGNTNHFGGDGTTTFAVPNWDINIWWYINAKPRYALNIPQVNYSTEEMLVGKWMELNLYEKLLVFNSINTNVDIVILDHNIENIGLIFIVDAFVRSNTCWGDGYVSSMPLCNEANNIMINTTQIKWLVHSYSNHGGDLYIRVRYTKTTG